jgi:hypothetical protein
MPSHKTAAVLLSLLLATAAYAADEVEPIDVCKDLARQKNKPMSETLPIAIDRFKDLEDKYGGEVDMEADREAENKEMAAELVMAAYARPSYGIEELQRREISDFENSVFGDCYTAVTFDSEE